MGDDKLIIVSAKMPDEFMKKVNQYLECGSWRVAETEMSVTDNHYFAMLIKERVEIIEVLPATPEEKP